MCSGIFWKTPNREVWNSMTNPYRAVLAWFKKKYSDVNDYMDFFEELAAKNAAENDMFAVPTATNL